jgi:hypothetical protein
VSYVFLVEKLPFNVVIWLTGVYIILVHIQHCFSFGADLKHRLVVIFSVQKQNQQPLTMTHYEVAEDGHDNCLGQEGNGLLFCVMKLSPAADTKVIRWTTDSYPNLRSNFTFN